VLRPGPTAHRHSDLVHGVHGVDRKIWSHGRKSDTGATGTPRIKASTVIRKFHGRRHRAGDLPVQAPHDVDDVVSACESLYRQEHTQLLRLLTRLGVPTGDTESVAHDVWSAFFIWLPDHQDHPSPVGVLYTIAKRRAVDYHRTNRSQPVEHSVLEALAAAVLPTLGLSDLRIDLERALTSLAPRERRALQLHYVNQHSVAATATLLGTGMDNTKKIIKRALKSLREHPSLSGYQAPGKDAQEVRK
jgi:RNA polymerase sigma factor (sigma-70 family)